MDQNVYIDRAGIGAKINFGDFFQTTVEKGYRTRIARQTLYGFAKAVRSRTKMYFEQRTDGIGGNPSRGDRPGSLGDAFEFNVIETSKKVPNTVTFEVGKGFVQAEYMDKPVGQQTEIFSSPRLQATYFSFRDGTWRFFSTVKPVKKVGIGFFSDALSYVSAHELQGIFENAVEDVLSKDN